MKLKEFLRSELDREVERSRHALEQIPEGKYDWKPHEKSMIFGYLANMVATIPMWISMQIDRDELDIAPTDGGKFEQKRLDTSAEFLEALDAAAGGARAAFDKTTDEHLMTNWQLKAGGNVVMEAPRHEMIQEIQKLTEDIRTLSYSSTKAAAEKIRHLQQRRRELRAQFEAAEP